MTARVLVVSENASERLRTTAALRARPDVELVEATSAAEGHRLAVNENFDVVVIDGDMRPEGGFSLLYELRAAAQMRGVPAAPAILLIAREQDRWLAQWAGAEEALVKPIDSFFVAGRVLGLHAATGGEVPSATPGQTVGQELAMDHPPELAGERPPGSAGQQSG